VASLLLASSATAATRFAAPGGTGVDPCTNAAQPCSIFSAAAVNAPGTTVAAGDEVVLAPGQYSSNDLGPTGNVEIRPGVNVRGAAGQPRPMITLTRSSFGAFTVRLNSTVSHLEIDSAVAASNIIVAGGTVEDLISRSSASSGSTVFACTHRSGVIRNSICISSGAGAAAVGTATNIDGLQTAQLRNVTAVATGPRSSGLTYRALGEGTLMVQAKGVIAKGAANDVAAEGLSNPPTPGGADVRIDLDHSNYATISTATDAGGGTAIVTPAGSGTNIVAPALLTPDNLHQLAGSPTIDRGETDALSGATDIDGHPRTLGAAPDIGADEAVPSATTLACAAGSVAVGASSNCTVTVTAPVPTPSGTVRFTSDGGGTFDNGGVCDLEPGGPDGLSCEIAYTPTAAGDHSHRITANYLGNETHLPSVGTADLTVGRIRFAAPGGTGADPCVSPAQPCSVFTAASADAPGTTVQAGDEAVLAPGEYSDAAGDLGPEGFVDIEPGISVHGASGQPRPVIQLEEAGPSGAFGVGANVTVSHLEIDGEVARTNISVFSGGVVEDMIARSDSNAPSTIVCAQQGGLIRDSVCLSSGAGATALGVDTSLNAPSSAQLRNVTAVATGPGSFGLNYRLFGAQSFDVFAKSVIARGDGTDVFAAGLSPTPGMSGTGADVQIKLDHSAYEDSGTRTDGGGGTAVVTLPGIASNILDPPLLAVDGYHQLAASPTVDAGNTDAFSGALDIDGQPRTVGDFPDIGADEFVVTQEPPAMPPETPVAPLSPSPSLGGGPSAPPARPAPPQTRLGKHPEANEHKRLALFTFSANPAGGRFECKLDGKPFKRCTSPYKATVEPGRHTFRVRAVSAAGVADPTPASFSWKVARARR
jgi:hypothetical protein